MKKIRLLFLALIVLTSLFPTSMSVAFADSGTVQGSNVLDDLSNDTSFSQYNYPINEADNTIEIISIAESWNNELLIYTYQPNVSKNYRANYISMSTTINDSINPAIYELTYCNSNGTLVKYVVDDFTVSSQDEVRYYEIYSIFRPFDETVDDSADNDNTINSVSFEVSKQWRVGSVNGNAYIECDNIQVVVVEDKYVGFCRYFNGVNILDFDYPSFTDCHFVAFSTTCDIDELYEADVFFKRRSYIYNDFTTENDRISYGDYIDDEVTCYSTKYVEQTSDKWLAYDYEYARIQDITTFLDTEVNAERTTFLFYDDSFLNICQTSDLTNECLSALENTKWVLRFYESPFIYNVDINSGRVYEESTQISHVTILRLKFKSNGLTYNLGVVDNMQTGTSVPSNKTGMEISLSEDFSEFLKVLLIIVGIIVLIALFPIVLKVISVIFKILFAPFKALFGGKSKQSYSRKRR